MCPHLGTKPLDPWPIPLNSRLNLKRWPQTQLNIMTVAYVVGCVNDLSSVAAHDLMFVTFAPSQSQEILNNRSDRKFDRRRRLMLAILCGELNCTVK